MRSGETLPPQVSPVNVCQFHHVAGVWDEGLYIVKTELLPQITLFLSHDSERESMYHSVDSNSPMLPEFQRPMETGDQASKASCIPEYDQNRSGSEKL